MGDLSDLLPGDLPKQLITVSYNGQPIEVGQQLTLEQSKNQPQVEWAPSSSLHTLLMLDFDAPTRGKVATLLSPINHWLVANIANGCDLASGELVCEYAGAGAPRYTGLHRYVFLLFEHEKKIDFEQKIGKRDIWARTKFPLVKWMQSNGLESVKAYNYFVAQAEQQQLCVCL